MAVCKQIIPWPKDKERKMESQLYKVEFINFVDCEIFVTIFLETEK